MRIAMFSSESLHSITTGGLGVHVTELAPVCSGGATMYTSLPDATVSITTTTSTVCTTTASIMA